MRRPRPAVPLSAIALLAILTAASPVPPASTGRGAGRRGGEAIAGEAMPGGDTIPGAVAAALPGVVGVARREVQKIPVFRDGRFALETIEGLGAGSGVVVSRDGLVVTNAHVVQGGADLRVRLLDGAEVPARIVSLDEASDLALLRVAASGLQPIPFADGPLPAAGSPGFVVGNRDGSGPSIAWSRVGPHRKVRAGERSIELWCEVEAAVAPGNSGGALLDADGRLLGVPSLLIRYAGGRDRASRPGSGLFIPAAHVARSLRRMREGAVAIWPFLGLVLDDPLLRAARGDPAQGDGVVVRSVIEGSPAEEAGLQPGDRVVAIGARRPADDFEALDAVLDLAPGAVAEIGIERGGEHLDRSVTLGVRPLDPRPDPLDEFALQTGITLGQSLDDAGRPSLVASGITTRARRDMPAFEAEAFAAGPALAAALAGADALGGETRRTSVATPRDLADLLERSFVGEQFVLLAHWTEAGARTIDRAHVHRKLYPVVL